MYARVSSDALFRGHGPAQCMIVYAAFDHEGLENILDASDAGPLGSERGVAVLMITDEVWGLRFMSQKVSLMKQLHRPHLLTDPQSQF